MWSLKAWGQGSGAPAYRQVVQRPTGACRSEGRDADVADRIFAEHKSVELRERPTLNRLSQSGEACVANVVVEQRQLLCMAHQTKVLRQGSAHAKSQGMVARQWGASIPSSGPVPHWHTHRRGL